MTQDEVETLVANLSDCINLISDDLESLLRQRYYLISTLSQVDADAAKQWKPLIDPWDGQ